MNQIPKYNRPLFYISSLFILINGVFLLWFVDSVNRDLLYNFENFKYGSISNNIKILTYGYLLSNIFYIILRFYSLILIKNIKRYSIFSIYDVLVVLIYYFYMPIIIYVVLNYRYDRILLESMPSMNYSFFYLYFIHHTAKLLHHIFIGNKTLKPIINISFYLLLFVIFISVHFVYGARF